MIFTHITKITEEDSTHTILSAFFALHTLTGFSGLETGRRIMYYKFKNPHHHMFLHHLCLSCLLVRNDLLSVFGVLVVVTSLLVDLTVVWVSPMLLDFMFPAVLLLLDGRHDAPEPAL